MSWLVDVWTLAAMSVSIDISRRSHVSSAPEMALRMCLSYIIFFLFNKYLQVFWFDWENKEGDGWEYPLRNLNLVEMNLLSSPAIHLKRFWYKLKCHQILMCIEIENNIYSDSPSHVSHIKKKIGCTLTVLIHHLKKK